MPKKSQVAEVDARSHLAALVDADGLRPTARQLGVSAPYLFDLINGNRKFSDAMLDKLGMRRVVVAKS